MTAARRLLAKPDKGGAHKPLNFAVRLDPEPCSHMTQCHLEQLGVGLCIKLRQLGKPCGSFLARLRIFALDAGGVIPQDVYTLADPPVGNPLPDVRLDVVRRDAPSFVGK